MVRPLKYGADKEERKLRVTEAGWVGAKEIATQFALPGIGDILEKIARGELVLSHPKPPADTETAIAQVLHTIPPRERSAVSRHLRKLVALL